MGQTLESRLTPKRLDEVTPKHPARPAPTNNTLQPSPLSIRQAPATLPQHIAIIMDGNRRWAKNKFMPAAVGHAAGAKRVRDIVKACSEMGVSYLSIFAFSTENWKRPADEVSSLMSLFMTFLQKEVDNMNDNGVRLKVVGDKTRFAPTLQELIARAETQTANNTRITLTVCANYGGRWDMLQATRAGNKPTPTKPCKASPKKAWHPTSAPRMRQRSTCSSAPVASRGSATSCFGKRPMPSCFSPTTCGPTFRPLACKKPSSGLVAETAALARLPLCEQPLPARHPSGAQSLGVRPALKASPKA
jgi:hypothetical protein